MEQDRLTSHASQFYISVIFILLLSLSLSSFIICKSQKANVNKSIHFHFEMVKLFSCLCFSPPLWRVSYENLVSILVIPMLKTPENVLPSCQKFTPYIIVEDPITNRYSNSLTIEKTKERFALFLVT